MPRNDTLLWSGASSASFARKKERNKQKLDKQLKFVKNAKYVFEELDAEKKILGELLNKIVSGDDTPEQIAVKLQAVRLHRDWLLGLEARLRIVLRAEPLEKGKTDEG